MLPSLAQGGCQAIEDAIVLTRCLTDEALSVPEALRRYETLRLPRTSHIQRVAWESRNYLRMPDGEEQQARDEQFASVGAAPALNGSDWLYSFDAERDAMERQS